MSKALLDQPTNTQTPVVHELPERDRRERRRPLLTPEITWSSLKQAFVMLRPDIQWKNPVMFVVEVGAFLTLLFVIEAALGNVASQVSLTYFIALDVWLFLDGALRELRDRGR